MYHCRKDEIRYPFSKQLMFAKVMEDPDLCRQFIERLFEGRRVKEVVVKGIETVTTEATKIPGIYAKYVRLDVLFEDDSSWNNIELQAVFQKELPKRSRYYSAAIDVTHLKSGEPYEDLKPSYVIFLCLFDYYGKDEAVYTFERFDRKNQLPCGDGSYIIIVNTECSPEKVPESLRPLFRYINTQEVDPEDRFVGAIHERVLKYQGDEEVAYNMTLEEDFLRERTKAQREGRAEGLAEGRAEGLAEGRAEGLAEGRAEGLAEGRAEGAADMARRLNKLGLLLQAAGRADDYFRSMEDPAFQQQLLEEFGLNDITK